MQAFVDNSGLITSLCQLQEHTDLRAPDSAQARVLRHFRLSDLPVSGHHTQWVIFCIGFCAIVVTMLLIDVCATNSVAQNIVIRTVPLAQTVHAMASYLIGLMGDLSKYIGDYPQFGRLEAYAKIATRKRGVMAN
jgi:hypothetical protein